MTRDFDQNLNLRQSETGSEADRDADRKLRIERFTSLQRLGRKRAEALGVRPDDSEALVDDVRSQRR